MKRILMLIFAVATTIPALADSMSMVQRPLWVVDGRAISEEEVNNLDSGIVSITVLNSSEEVEKFKHLGDVSNGVVVIALERSEVDEVFLFADVMPSYMGGDLTTFRSWVIQNLRYPEAALKSGWQDNVVVQFVVNREGYIAHDSINVLQSTYTVFADEVKRVITTSARWTPGIQNGRAVSVRMTLPVTFMIPGQKPIESAESAEESVDEVVVVAFDDGNLPKTDKAPLYIVDGVPVTAEEVNDIPAESVKMVALLTDTETLGYYKDFGDISNGVMIIHRYTYSDVAPEPSTQPKFMGGDWSTFREWFYSNLRYPEQLKGQNLSAHLVAQFVVNDKGYIEIQEITTIKGSDNPLFRDEVERVLLSSPQWTPGSSDDGEDVTTMGLIPVIFGEFIIDEAE